jgi:uncharacterized protein (DUF924 family)
LIRVTSEDVLDFWLGSEPDNPEIIASKRKLWFVGGDELDAEIRGRFEPTLTSILEGSMGSGATVAGSAVPGSAVESSAWSWQESPDGRLATIILLDQFSRNIYRGSARAFSQDLLAQKILAQGLDCGDERHLSFMERVFFYFPFHHAEDLAMQKRVVELMSALLDDAPEELKDAIGGNLEYATEHCEVVARFGRFPHRNEVMGRTSSPEEQAYLDSGARRYGQ